MKLIYDRIIKESLWDRKQESTQNLFLTEVEGSFGVGLSGECLREEFNNVGKARIRKLKKLLLDNDTEARRVLRPEDYWTMRTYLAHLKERKKERKYLTSLVRPLGGHECQRYLTTKASEGKSSSPKDRKSRLSRSI